MILVTHLFVPDSSFGWLDVLVESLSYSNEVRTGADNWMMPQSSPLENNAMGFYVVVGDGFDWRNGWLLVTIIDSCWIWPGSVLVQNVHLTIRQITQI
jgi:hypothetical protein